MNKSTQLGRNSVEILPKKNKIKVLITVGPTRAYLDAIRYLSNYSTGELGYRLSQALIKKNIEVVVVAGPTHQPFSRLPLKKFVEVETADQMCEAVLKECRNFRPDFAIFSAAVLDFKPDRILSGKTSSQKSEWKVRLVPTVKIVDEVGRLFPQIQRIGFKLEHQPKVGRALKQFGSTLLKEKKLDALIVNFFPQIQKTSHPAWLFIKGREMEKLEGKAEIAKRLAGLMRQLKQA